MSYNNIQHNDVQPPFAVVDPDQLFKLLEQTQFFPTLSGRVLFGESDGGQLKAVTRFGGELLVAPSGVTCRVDHWYSFKNRAHCTLLTWFCSVRAGETLAPLGTNPAELADCLAGKYLASGSVIRQLGLELETGWRT